ncbi:head maturation protease, ClpP-related [Rhodopseudomonas parapalustris]
MPKIYQFTKKDKTGKVKNAGRMEIKNETDNSADLYFFGDIVSIAYNPDDWWSWGDPEDKAPKDVADFLNSLDGKTDVNIHINSGGGDVFAGIAIYNILKNNSAKKTTYVEGLAASSASIIAFASDTVIVPNSAQLMIHNPWTVAMGNANDFRKMADTLDQISQSLINIYMDNAKDGVTEEKIKQLMDDESWFTGDQAAEYFNIQLDKSAPVAAYAGSEYFGCYKHVPESLVKNAKGNGNNTDDLSEVLKAIKSLENRLDGIEQANAKTSEEDLNQKNEALEKVKIAKAKLALKLKL